MDWTWILIGTAAGGTVMFVWLALAWMALPHHDRDFRGVPAADPDGVDPDGVDPDGSGGGARDFEAVLEPLEPGQAFYCVPFMKDFPGGQNDPAYKARMEKGPNAMITVLPRGDFMGGGVFLRGFLLNLLDAFGLAVLCSLIAVPALADKVLLGAAVGGFVGLSCYGGMSNWMFLPWRFAWTSVFDRIVGFAMIGLVLHFCLPASTPG